MVLREASRLRVDDRIRINDVPVWLRVTKVIAVPHSGWLLHCEGEGERGFDGEPLQYKRTVGLAPGDLVEVAV